jgi:hypothetical protein
VAEAGVLYYSLGRPKVHEVRAVDDELVVRIAGRRGTAVKAQ